VVTQLSGLQTVFSILFENGCYVNASTEKRAKRASVLSPSLEESKPAIFINRPFDDLSLSLSLAKPMVLSRSGPIPARGNLLCEYESPHEPPLHGNFSLSCSHLSREIFTIKRCRFGNLEHIVVCGTATTNHPVLFSRKSKFMASRIFVSVWRTTTLWIY
jgi:hypothetical protein